MTLLVMGLTSLILLWKRGLGIIWCEWSWSRKT